MPRPDFTTVTELPGGRATREQMSRMVSRYRLAADLCGQRDVLELACGAGLGLPYLARTARRVTGVDIDENNLAHARRLCAGNPKITVEAGDAQELAYADRSFDVVLLFEALYYLPRASDFVAEARRVLRPGGALVVAQVNPEWHGFNPSPHSQRYYAAAQLGALLEDAGFRVSLQAAFEDAPHRLRGRVVSVLRRAAIRAHLVPRTMRGKEWLKRLFYGPLTAIGTQVEDGMAPLEPAVPLVGPGPHVCHKVLYAVGYAPE